MGHRIFNINIRWNGGGFQDFRQKRNALGGVHFFFCLLLWVSIAKAMFCSKLCSESFLAYNVRKNYSMIPANLAS